MNDDTLNRLKSELANAEAEVTRLKGEYTELARAQQMDPSEEGREAGARAAAALAAARARVETARAELLVFSRKGSGYGLVQEGERVVGRIAVALKPGASREERERAVDEALNAELVDAASALGVVLAAPPLKYTRELPGRDAEGRTVLEVLGRVEADRLVPAVSRTAQKRRK